MTDREAMFALAAPEPDYFDAPYQWQEWHDKMIKARTHVRVEEIAIEKKKEKRRTPQSLLDKRIVW